MSMRFSFILAAFVATTAGAQAAPGAQGAASGLTLQQAIEMAQRNGLQAQAALGTRDAARGRDRAFDARLLPQFSLAGNMPVYQRTIIGVIQPDGSTLFLPLEERRANLNMVVSQIGRASW